MAILNDIRDFLTARNLPLNTNGMYRYGKVMDEAVGLQVTYVLNLGGGYILQVDNPAGVLSVPYNEIMNNIVPGICILDYVIGINITTPTETLEFLFPIDSNPYTRQLFSIKPPFKN